MKILFWLYKSRAVKNGCIPIKMRITINAKRVDFTTGLEVYEDKWDQIDQRIKGKDFETFQRNDTLHTLRALAWEIYNHHLRNKLPITPEIIKSQILKRDQPNHTLVEAIDYQINNLKGRVGNDIAPNTVKKYETIKRKVLDFMNVKHKRSDILLSELSGKFIYEFDAFLRTEKKLSHNAIAKNMQQLKRVITVAVQNEWLPKDPFTHYTCSPKETERGFLTSEELVLLEKAVLSDKLKRVRDLFLFCCYTGLAYADVSKLSKDHLIKGEDGNTWIIISRTKSKSQALIPILPKARQILNIYQDFVLSTKRLLPIISNQNYNKYLKELGDIASINKRMSSHLARHTFATTVTLNNGVDIATVSKMLGHKNIRTTQIYAKISMVKIAADIKKIM